MSRIPVTRYLRLPPGHHITPEGGLWMKSPKEVQKLFAPLNIGKMQLKNRIVLGPMVANMATEEGYVTEALKNYHANIAKGGVALSTLESTYISLEGKRLPRQLAIYDDKFIPGLQELADTIRQNGAKTSLQIAHGGRACISEISGFQPVAPTNLPSTYRSVAKFGKSVEWPRQLTLSEIEEIVEKFGDSARRAKEAGIDAVEVHGAHGYLICNFLSPFSNRRTDKYGGDAQGRATFLIEVIRNVKKKAGNDFPVVVKINGLDYVEGGVTVEDAKVTARLIEENGGDAIVVSVCMHESRPYMMVPAMFFPTFLNVHLSEQIKKVVGIPVGTIGRVVEPIRASQIIEQGKADFVVMARGLLSDPEFPNKVAEGRFDDVRECLGCNGGCRRHHTMLSSITCTQNPSIGNETEFVITKAARPKKVLIIGGGPGGLQAARVAALRGHEVILYEKESRLGGQINTGSIAPKRQELAKMTEWLTGQVRKLKVTIHMGINVTPELVAPIRPDVIIVATGTISLIPEIPGVDREHVVTAVDILTGKAEVGKKVVIVGAGLVGLEVADFLASQGKEVIMLEMADDIALGADASEHIYYGDHLREIGVEILTNAKVIEIRQDGVVFTHKNWAREILQPDNVVLATGALPNNRLYEDLKKSYAHVIAIGDCRQPRKALEANLEGWKTALEI